VSKKLARFRHIQIPEKCPGCGGELTAFVPSLSQLDRAYAKCALCGREYIYRPGWEAESKIEIERTGEVLE